MNNGKALSVKELNSLAEKMKKRLAVSNHSEQTIFNPKITQRIFTRWSIAMLACKTQKANIAAKQNVILKMMKLNISIGLKMSYFIRLPKKGRTTLFIKIT